MAAVLPSAIVVRQAMVALASDDNRRYSRVAWLGAERDVSLLLAKAGERAIQVRHGVVQIEEKLGGACQIAHPILIGDVLHGVVAIELPIEAKEHLDVAMRLAQWGVAWFAHLFAERRPDNVPGGPNLLRYQALTMALSAGRYEPALEATATLLADTLQADKVSFGRHRHGRTKLIALSHGGFAGVQNDYLAKLVAAMDESVDAGGSQFPVPSSEMAHPHASHAALARAHEADWVQSVAGFLSPNGEDQLVLLAEGRGAPPADIQEKLEAVADDLAPLLWMRIKAQQGALSRLLEQAARLSKVTPQVRHAIFAGLALAFVALLLVPLPHRISVDATVETTERRVVAAPFDGYLAEATARPGDFVKAGQIIGRFDDRDLRNQRADVTQRLSETSRELNQAIGVFDRAKASVLTARKAQSEAELALVEDQLRRIELRSPFDAVVIAGDKTQSIGSPMRRGEPLYELSPLGSYRVSLEIPQVDVADIKPGQTGELVLSALPYDTIGFRVTRVTPIAIARDQKSILRAEADLLTSPGLLRPGMQGVAHIRVGDARVGWLFTHRVLEWVRLRLWGWVP